MANYFHRQLGYYADAHRDRVNSIMHMIGNPILFVAVVLPLSLLPVSQMLISPMYIFAKLFVALGLRPDLAAVLQKSSQQTLLDRPYRPVGGQADVGKTP
jgi:uncharacterized membrane protein YGL010W